jgi:hypothetical protein
VQLLSPIFSEDEEVVGVGGKKDGSWKGGFGLAAHAMLRLFAKFEMLITCSEGLRKSREIRSRCLVLVKDLCFG